MKERLQKILSSAGVCSRREAERLIQMGEVSVNGVVVRTLGAKADPLTDRIEVGGERVRGSSQRVYLVLHKPRGCVTTARDPEGRKTVIDLLKGVKERVYPVGRLDYAAEGLLLMTNDGPLAYALMRPGGVPKTYQVRVKGTPSPEALERLRKGLMLDGRRLLPVEARVDSRGENSWLTLTLHEGQKNQIVRMLLVLGHPVRRLRRVAIGPLRLGKLAPGRWRPLTEGELSFLTRAASSKPQHHPGGKQRPVPGRSGAGRGTPGGRQNHHLT